jgi:hypothetical protein
MDTAEYPDATFKLTKPLALGSIPIVFSDWNIANPSCAGFVTTQNHGPLEFLIIARRALRCA